MLHCLVMILYILSILKMMIVLDIKSNYSATILNVMKPYRFQIIPVLIKREIILYTLIFYIALLLFQLKVSKTFP